MILFRRLRTGAMATLCLLSTVARSNAEDYASLPPMPAQEAQRLKEAKVSLVEAIRTAEDELSGLAREARFVVENGRRDIEVTVYAGAEARRVIVDGSTGEVTKNVLVPYLPGAPVSGDPVTTSSGLIYFDIKEGGGETPPGPSTTVKVHYTGWLVTGKKFDSSVDRGEPATFPLNRVIAGWTEGVGSMKVGGKRKLLIPYQLAYDVDGRPPVIPPKAALIFDVELIAIVKK